MNSLTLCDGDTVRVPAGNRYRFAWPLVIAAPSTKDDLDAVALVTTRSNNTTVEEGVELTDGVDAQHITAAVEVEFPDTAVGRYTIALDVDDASGDLARQQFDVVVEPAIAQRTP